MRFAIPLLALGLAVLVFASAALLIRSCGLRLPFTGHVINACPVDVAGQRDARLAVLEDERADLRRAISLLERELARQQCVAEAPPPPELPPQVPEDGFDREGFENRDVAILEGCWQLDSDYSTVNIQTGAVTRYNEWQMCFDAQGTGYQVMRSPDGTTCQSSVTGAFNTRGELTIDDLDRVPCTNGTGIFRRETICTLDEQGRANCASRHPERPRRDPASVGFRRVTEGRP